MTHPCLFHTHLVWLKFDRKLSVYHVVVVFVECPVIDKSILYSELQIFRKEVVGTNFIESLGRIPFAIAIHIVASLDINLVFLAYTRGT